METVMSATATIASSGNLSGGVSQGKATLTGIVMPSAWDAANLTFQVSYDGTNYANLYDEYGTEYAVVASTSRHIYLNPQVFAGAYSIKVRSGTSGTPVTQTATRSIVLVFVPMWVG